MTSSIKMYKLDEISELIGFKIDKLDVNYLKEGCKLANINMIEGGVFFVPKKPNDPLEEEYSLQKQLYNQFAGYYNNSYLIIDKIEEKNHPRYSYYNIVVVLSDLNNLKIAFKVHKLKAFI